MRGAAHSLRDAGAAAVEFALVTPVLLLLLFGIIDYGLWFNASLSVRQGVRESARQAVVLHPATGCAGTNMAAVACSTRSQILTSGAAYAKVFAPNGWVRGEKLVVCGMVTATSFTGFVPLPVGGLIKSKTTMSIEVVPSPLPNVAPYEDTPPSGGNWSWCIA
jgi:Flp pilus assembly protein TadG